MRLFHLLDIMSIMGTIIRSSSVSFQLIEAISANVPISIHTDIKKSSGPWCASSAISLRSLTMRDIS